MKTPIEEKTLTAMINIIAFIIAVILAKVIVNLLVN